MFCRNCGQPLSDAAQFCPNCGTRIQPVIVVNESADRTTEPSFEKPVSVAAAQAVNETAEKPAKKIFDRVKLVFSSLGTVLLIVIAIISFSRHPAANMKEVVFDDFGSETIGEAVERNIAHPEWSAVKISKNHYRVTVEGFMKPVGGNFSMTFDVNYLDDEVYAKPILASYDDEEFDDWFSLAIAMGLLYD